MTDSGAKFFIGPMSKNVVDAIIDVNNDTDLRIGFIPSRRQVEYNGGYVNDWTTKTFSEYVRNQNNSIIIERDHGGPGQGYQDDDGKSSYTSDAKCFDIIHIDPWKKYTTYEDGLNKTISGINLCYSVNPDCYYEVGTEQAIRNFSLEELERLIVDLRKSLSKDIFLRIKYIVVQSGVGLDLGEQKNIGVFNPDRLREMVKIGGNNNLLCKEHNGDYLTISDMKDRFELGLDAINIAPQFGQFETDVYLEILNDLQNSLFEEFYRICYESKRWEKWVKPDFNPKQEKEKIIKISGHYVFSNPEFVNLKNKMSDNLEIPVTQIDAKVKDRIKAHILSFKKSLI